MQASSQPSTQVQAPPPPTPGQAPLVSFGHPGADPVLVYEGLRNQRSELRSQLDRLQSDRRSIARQLRNDGPIPQRSGLEQRIASLDQRIIAVDKQLAEADAAVSRAAAVPGAVVPPPPPLPRQGPPEEFFVLAGIFMFIFLLPMSIAFARRIWKKGSATVAALPQEIWDRFTRMEQAVDAVAVEVERIGEGQRFLTRMYAEQQQRALAQGPAERVEIGAREGERQGRK